MLDAIVRLTISNALKGDPKSLSNCFALLRQVGLLDEEPDAGRIEYGNAEDEAILADYLQRVGLPAHAALGDEVPEVDPNASPTKSK